MEVENCIVKSTMLGNEDHGILTAFLMLEGDGWGTGFGGYAFDQWNEAQKKRVGQAYGMRFIAAILDTLEVERWERLPGTHLRVRFDHPLGKAVAIGHYVKNRWFDPKSLLEG